MGAGTLRWGPATPTAASDSCSSGTFKTVPYSAGFLAIVAAAFLLRIVLEVILRPDHPAAADVVSHWWIWIPFVVVIVGAGYYLHPLVSVAVTIVGIVLTARDPHVGLPSHRRGPTRGQSSDT